ncbi:MAG TPA: hypothetical protein VMK16_12310 [Acidimicrobiales bacterium]|nr:hypothetical protein [Acidimicrobiales bacterium]
MGALVVMLALICTSCGDDDGASSAAASTTPVTSSTTSTAPALTGECATGVATSISGIRNTLDRVDDAPAGTVSVNDEVLGILDALNDGFGIDGCESLGSQRPPYTAIVVSLIQEEAQRRGPSKEIVSALLENFCHGENSGDLTNEGREACAARG